MWYFLWRLKYLSIYFLDINPFFVYVDSNIFVCRYFFGKILSVLSSLGTSANVIIAQSYFIILVRELRRDWTELKKKEVLCYYITTIGSTLVFQNNLDLRDSHIYLFKYEKLNHYFRFDPSISLLTCISS